MLRVDARARGASSWAPRCAAAIAEMASWWEATSGWWEAARKWWSDAPPAAAESGGYPAPNRAPSSDRGSAHGEGGVGTKAVASAVWTKTAPIGAFVTVAKQTIQQTDTPRVYINHAASRCMSPPRANWGILSRCPSFGSLRLSG